MAHITQESLATIHFTLEWDSSHATHVEHYLAKDVSFVRDILPLGIKSQMLGLRVGDAITIKMDPSEVPPFKPGKVLDMPQARFQPPVVDGRSTKARVGRYYPKNFIEAVPGTRPESETPFRVMEGDRAGFKANMNHPMADRDVAIRAEVVSISEKESIPGELKRWSATLLSGPGMQARLPETPTDFLGDDPFKRLDESEEAAPLLMDAQGLDNVRNIYGSVLGEGLDVLEIGPGSDFLPSDEDDEGSVATHPLSELNSDPKLPFDDEMFDAVVCTGGAPYMTKPNEVFEEVARVLKPGGVFVLAFSDKWDDGKVVQVWTDLYEFERMGLVSQYFIRTELYEDIVTFSARGQGAPIYAVWGVKK